MPKLLYIASNFFRKLKIFRPSKAAGAPGVPRSRSRYITEDTILTDASYTYWDPWSDEVGIKPIDINIVELIFYYYIILDIFSNISNIFFSTIIIYFNTLSKYEVLYNNSEPKYYNKERI